MAPKIWRGKQTFYWSIVDFFGLELDNGKVVMSCHLSIPPNSTMQEAPSQPLLGRIMYHIVCSQSGKKRARPSEDENETTSLDSNSIFRRGFIFVSEEEGQQQGQEYSLVVPYQLLRIASHAASSGQLVRISRYCLLRYKDDWGEVLFSSGGVKNKKHKVSAMDQRGGKEGSLVIEVFVDGLSLAASSGNDGEDEKEEEMQSPVLTLETLAQNEHQQLTKGKKKKSRDKLPIHVTGVVDSISPILVNDPQQDPFAIMELYQPPSTEEITKTAVVIIRGERALSMHPAIHPGQAITLMGVVHRKWKVPDEFRKRLSERQSNETSLFERLCYCVPGRVILVTEASTIKWNAVTNLKPDLSLPSTVESLTSMRGIVKSVHYHCEERNGKANRVLHYVTIKPLSVLQEKESESASNELKLARIYLPKYATPPNVCLGLQAESIIRAVNIHFIPPPIGDEKKCPSNHRVSNDYLCYVACLRSTISIEKCAGECSHRIRSSNIWYVPSWKPFLLVPDSRISDICADRFHSRSSAQLLAEHRLRCELRNNHRLTQDIPSEALSTLLTHHYQIVDDCDQPVTNCEHVRCNCPTRKSKIMPLENGMSDRQTIRDPYAEFFDHSQSDSHGDWMIECGSCSSSFSCFNRYRQSTSETMPIVIGTEHLRNACTQYFTQRVGSLSRSGTQTKAYELQAGWTTSFNFEGLKLLQVLNDYFMQSDKDPISWCEKDSINVYTGGSIAYTDQNITSSFLLRNDVCTIPVFNVNRREGDDGIKSTQSNERSFRWVHIDSINLSCLCLGPCTKKKMTSVHAAYHHVFLPSAFSESVPGHTFSFLIDNLVFIGSMYIVAKSILPTTVNQSWKSEMNLGGCDTTGNAPHAADSKLGIAVCLEQTATSHQIDNRSIIIGRLMRNRFKFRKVKSTQKAGQVETQLEKCYEGWSVTLCHIDHSGQSASNSASTLQTIEVTISIPFCNSNASNSAVSLHALKSGLRELFNSQNATNSGARITSDQETMCLAWWHASGCQTLPILSGGLDLSEDSLPVHVEIPLSARTFAKLGYQRFRCHFSELEAYHVVETHAHSTSLSKGNMHVNTHKILPGMLNRRLHRTTPSVPSPLTYLKPGGGISPVSLAELHWDVCKAIRYEDSTYLKPSLLRRIHDVKILGVSFCRARVECQQCFKTLVEKRGNTELIEGNRAEGSTLLCPSGCSQSQACVKWECSAIVDDGTGQAKLYAEREAALLLLGTDLDIVSVESGAWYCEEGVFFQPSLPPSSSLAQSIRAASAKARKHISSSKRKYNLGEELSSTYSLLPDNAKAEYLLQQHCRHWSHQHGQRRLDLFCRCKPLSEDLSLNGTEINVAKAMVAHVGLEFGMTGTATLPPLKLTLEDACVCSEERMEDKLVGWDLLKAF
eukprot:scaffold10660_cov136-Skeletonema_marinoi.AAC.8